MNLIFDLDGTLLYTLEDLQTAVNFALNKFDYPQRSLSEIQQAVGDGLKMLVYRSLPLSDREKMSDSALSVMKEYYKAHCHDATKPYDGIIETLQKLKNMGHRLAIVSNKADIMVQELTDIYFSDLIDFAIGENESMMRKPAADMVNAAKSALGNDALYIGDSEVDILTAENADIPCICVSWGYRSAEFLKKSGAKQICSTPDELLQHIVNTAPK